MNGVVYKERPKCRVNSVEVCRHFSVVGRFLKKSCTRSCSRIRLCKILVGLNFSESSIFYYRISTASIGASPTKESKIET